MSAPTDFKLSDPCRCGHTFAVHCTPDEPNGGYCAASNIGRRVDGCACSAFEYDGRSDLEPAGPDHTSGVMRCRYQVLGGYVQCAIFGPFSGKAGDLTFRVNEWEHFKRTHPNWLFQERARDV